LVTFFRFDPRLTGLEIELNFFPSSLSCLWEEEGLGKAGFGTPPGS
jgi:hypothetical protein